MASPEFVHLHVHSQYSMLDGAVKVKDLVKRVSKDGMKAVAVTDHGNMFGSISFYKAAKEAGVQAIIGCEVEVADKGRARHLPLIASTLEGYKNLVALVSMGHVRPEPEGPMGVPTVSLETVAKYSKGLIAMTGCMGGVVPQAILEQGEEAGKKALEQMKSIFEPGALYVELQDHGLPEQPIINEILLQHARFFGLPSVATNDVHFPGRDDAQAALYLSCIETKRTYAEAVERHHGSSEMYLKSPIEMAELFSSHPDALRATLEIAERCKGLKLKLGEPMLPNFAVPEGYDTESYFREVARKGLERRFEELKNVDRDKYRARLEMELDVISKMKFPGYFLIVWDFIRYAKENGVPVGPGRGSGAGSIVAYAMRITDIDPIPLDLLFERFLNPERISMPDFDVDFCMDKRDRVITYVQKKYGEESVGQIATFAELKAKSVIKDVGRALGMLPVEQQALANLIPRKTPAETYTIQESLQIEPKLKQRYESEPQVRECLTQASKLEGLIRQAGKHAAGIVISEGALWDHVPVFKDPQTNSYITQYYKDDVEAAGLVKFDFLGLKTLTVLDIATQLIRARAPEFHLESVPLDDKPTYALLASGETKGVFQLESSGMQQLFKDLKADCFEDIVAAVALYRPGPLGSGMVADFVNRKNKRAKVESLHAMVDAILVPTYGVIVYQEQVMQVAQALAGYTLGGADILRRAMGKKKPEEMAKQKGIFVEGALAKGVTQEDAERIFGLLEFFAGYGFNKCVVGSTEIVNARTGERTTVRDLFERRRAFSIHALGDDGKLHTRPVTDVMWNGRKRVFKLTTEHGKRITATDNHPFRTREGWTNLGELRVGDSVAASARWPAPSSTRKNLQKSGKFDDFAALKLTALASATVLNVDADVATSKDDILWERIVSIEDAGVEDTFDLTVDVDHNFVADGLIVHNSHSAAYALITYQTAWLKAHYPAELLCAILTSDKDRIEKVVRTIADARAMGITVLPPDINESDTDFKVVYGEETQSKKKGKKLLPQIRFGLGAVRGIGGAALESIFEARKAGKFIDLFDFASRVDAAKINKAVLQALVQCGAFDSTFDALGTSRARAYASIDVALERLRAATRDRERGQTNLFGLFDAAPSAASSSQKWNAPSAGDYVEAAPWDRKEMLTRERESLGFYVSGHPLERYLKGGSSLARLEALPASSCNEQQDWAVVKLAGMVEGYRERIFRDGATSNKLAFFELEDLSGRVQVKVRGNQIDSYAHVLTSSEPILLTGKVSFPRRDDDEAEPDADTPREATILLNDAVLLSDVVASSTKQVLLRLHADQIREGTLEKMSRVMRESPGNCGVWVHLVLPTGAEATLSLGPGHRVEIGDALLAGFERIFGSQVAELR